MQQYKPKGEAMNKDEELKISADKVREAAAKCPTAKEVLKTLFPQAFKKETPFVEGGFYIMEETGVLYRLLKHAEDYNLIRMYADATDRYDGHTWSNWQTAEGIQKDIDRFFIFIEKD